jgi:putative flippase GtrA
MTRMHDRLTSQGPQAQLLRFLLVGASNFVLSFALFHGLLALPVGLAVAPFLAQLVSYSVGTAWSFFWNRQFTFRATGGAIEQASRFLALQAMLALVSAVCVDAAIGHAGLSPMVAWFTVMSAVTVVNFLLSRHWAFGR